MADRFNESFLKELRRIVGEENTISAPEDLLVYECDAYTLEKNLPNVVVLPRTTEEDSSGSKTLLLQRSADNSTRAQAPA